MSEVRRLQELEMAVTKLRSDLDNHVHLCDARMRVIWKLAGGLSALVAATVSVAITLAR